MFDGNQTALDDERRKHSSRPPADHPSSPQDSLPFPPNRLASSSSNHDSSYGLSAQHEWSESRTRTLEAGRAARPAPRPSQNRAPFGKWKSKLIPGYPAADTPLPHGITAKVVCQLYPNHVNDHVILALMREGKGAKAIDALIPAPPGKQKAGQSHSKIQLRVSTIREAFPDENFPITSTKRIRARSRVAENRAMSSEDDGAVSLTADVFSASTEDTGKASMIGGPRIGKIQLQNSDDVLEAVRSDRSMRTSGYEGPPDIGGFASLRWSPLHMTGPTLSLGASGSPARSTSELATDLSHLHQTPFLKDQIKIEYQKHHQLVLDIYYNNEPLSRTELKEAIRAHCAAKYDAVSRELQASCGSVLDKMSVANGKLEHPISYLQRSITGCFQGLPEFRALVNFGYPEDHIGKLVETAVIQDLLDRFRGWTRELETKLQIARQIRAHKNAHVETSSKRTVVPEQHPRVTTSSQFSTGNNGSNSQPNPFLPLSPTPRSQPAGAPDDGARSAVKALFTTSASGDVGIEGSVPGAGCSGKAQSSTMPTSPNPLQDWEPESRNQASANLPEHPSSLQHLDKRAERPNGQPKIRRSAPASELEDRMIIDGALSSSEGTGHEFETYMEEAGEFVNHEAREIDLPPVSGKLWIETFFESV